MSKQIVLLINVEDGNSSITSRLVDSIKEGDYIEITNSSVATHAEQISDLLDYVGWVDDAYELLYDIHRADGRPAAVAQADKIVNLMNAINPHLERPLETDIHRFIDEFE